MTTYDPLTGPVAALVSYLLNETPLQVVRRLFPAAHFEYHDEKTSMLMNAPLFWFSQLDSEHQRLVVSHALTCGTLPGTYAKAVGCARALAELAPLLNEEHRRELRAMVREALDVDEGVFRMLNAGASCRDCGQTIGDLHMVGCNVGGDLEVVEPQDCARMARRG